MRTPTLAFAVLTILSPLAMSAPLTARGPTKAEIAQPVHHIARGVPSVAKDVMLNKGQPIVSGGTLHSRDVVRRPVVGTVVSGWPKVSSPQQLSKKALDKDTAGGNAYSGSAGDVSGGGAGGIRHGGLSAFDRRTNDDDTMGGNAYTGNSGDVSGGSIENIANNDGMPTLMNIGSNNAGLGGTSTSGCATGGYTDQNGAGGNAYSGSAGNAEGGSVNNVGGMVNMNSNNAGAAGTSTTGCATGGNVDEAPENEDFIL
ncbi:uncharacterized protein B0H18DRAFT_200331 [Fomitopsis serialis]|uniref:uncharacterized protein n=1 Tax=Fomitopsis serialis TaxID=139415 RepID=UPI002007BBC4|nr:uncharacterized protein B0H18DRAFT_200331 [Neoantrodia serialis]KAH9937516.1 hypothetical protein B0H18DRAFT_200331 [Neoantrodia serialis]